MACVVSFLFLAKELSILSRRGEAGRDIESSVPLSRADRNLPWDESVCARTYTLHEIGRLVLVLQPVGTMVQAIN